MPQSRILSTLPPSLNPNTPNNLKFNGLKRPPKPNKSLLIKNLNYNQNLTRKSNLSSKNRNIRQNIYLKIKFHQIQTNTVMMNPITIGRVN